MGTLTEMTDHVSNGAEHGITAASERTSGMAVAALILACLSVLIGPFGFIPAIILGYAASAACRREPGLHGAGYAKAALWIAYAVLILWVLVILAVTGMTAAPATG
jgi:hypothetical protein